MTTSPPSRETDSVDRPTRNIKIRQSRLARRATATFFAAACFTSIASAAGYVETDLVTNRSPLKDANGIIHTPTNTTDANLVNPWGVSESPGTSGSPFWVGDNGAGRSTLYITDGTPQSLVVSIPAPGADPLGHDGAPTGLVFNIASGTGAFKVSGCSPAGADTSAPALFLFATEDGTILGWNSTVAPKTGPTCTAFTPPNTHAIIVPSADRSASGAVYKGLAITNANGTPLLYATDFHNGQVDVYDASFQPASTVVPNAFVDPKLQKGYAPFNIVPIGNRLFVTYAVQDADAHDDVAGQANGIVDTYAFNGQMLARFAQHGQLDSPWGVALAPATFGEAAGKLLIGNFGNGHINIFDPDSGQFVNKLRDTHGQALVIDGLWTIMFGNGGRGGDPNLLYFTAGPNDESDGIFGNIAPGP
jgi:uncharacterized protein (TIGR03118 family)